MLIHFVDAFPFLVRQQCTSKFRSLCLHAISTEDVVAVEVHSNYAYSCWHNVCNVCMT